MSSILLTNWPNGGRLKFHLLGIINHNNPMCRGDLLLTGSRVDVTNYGCWREWGQIWRPISHNLKKKSFKLFYKWVSTIFIRHLTKSGGFLKWSKTLFITPLIYVSGSAKKLKLNKTLTCPARSASNVLGNWKSNLTFVSQGGGH